MFLETVSNPTEKDHFSAEMPYPSVITRIYSEPDGENDCMVNFIFLVFNGYVLKEIKHTCTNVFTSGKENFKNFCEALLFDSDRDEYADGKEHWNDSFDLNYFVGLGFIVYVIDDDIQKICQCYYSEKEYLGWDFDTIFDNADEDNFNSEISEKINTLLHELFNEAVYEYDGIISDGNIPF